MPAQSKSSVLSLLKSYQEPIRALGVRRLGLFGSFARGQAGDESDVDLLVEFEQGQKTFDNFTRLAFLLEDILERRVELVTPESISPYIRPYVIREVEYVAFAA